MKRVKCGSRTCKPNSVHLAVGRPFLWAAHCCAALATYPEVWRTEPARIPPPLKQQRAMSGEPYLIAHSSRLAPHSATAKPSSLFGLAPCGVCPARDIAVAAVRSYRTFSPLPRRNGAVCFLWHFPSASLDAGFPDVIRHTALWSSDFPPPPLDATRAAVRSSCLQIDYS